MGPESGQLLPSMSSTQSSESLRSYFWRRGRLQFLKASGSSSCIDHELNDDHFNWNDAVLEATERLWTAMASSSGRLDAFSSPTPGV